MFKTFYARYSDLVEFDEFLNKIVADGYEPVFIREQFRPYWTGYEWRTVAEVLVTARTAR